MWNCTRMKTMTDSPNHFDNWYCSVNPTAAPTVTTEDPTPAPTVAPTAAPTVGLTISTIRTTTASTAASIRGLDTNRPIEIKDLENSIADLNSSLSNNSSIYSNHFRNYLFTQKINKIEI